MQHALGTVGETEEHIAIVLQSAALASEEDGEVGGKLFDVQSRDVFCQIDGVSSDVAHAARGSADCRIDAPGRLFLAGVLQHRRQPALRIFDDHFADFSQLALLDHLPGLAHQRVAGVVVGDAVEES